MQYRKATAEDYQRLGIAQKGEHMRVFAEEMKRGIIRKVFGMRPKGTGKYVWVLPSELK